MHAQTRNICVCAMTDVLMWPDVPEDPALQRRVCILYALIVVGLGFMKRCFHAEVFVLFGSTMTANGEIHH